MSLDNSCLQDKQDVLAKIITGSTCLDDSNHEPVRRRLSLNNMMAKPTTFLATSWKQSVMSPLQTPKLWKFLNCNCVTRQLVKLEAVAQQNSNRTKKICFAAAVLLQPNNYDHGTNDMELSLLDSTAPPETVFLYMTLHKLATQSADGILPCEDNTKARCANSYASDSDDGEIHLWPRAKGVQHLSNLNPSDHLAPMQACTPSTSPLAGTMLTRFQVASSALLLLREDRKWKCTSMLIHDALHDLSRSREPKEKNLHVP